MLESWFINISIQIKKSNKTFLPKVGSDEDPFLSIICKICVAASDTLMKRGGEYCFTFLVRDSIVGSFTWISKKTKKMNFQANGEFLRKF